MIIYPAIDIKQGKCVRLFQGEMENVTIFSDDPVETAKRWEAAGAQFIHLVDLDGAVSGQPKHLKIVEKIIHSIDIPIQFGGGIRNLVILKEILELGVERAVLGTSAIKSPEFVTEACREYGSRIVVGIDSREGKLAIRGWKETTQEEAVEVAKRMEELGVPRLVCTDIERDGMLAGPNIEAIRAMVEAVNIPVIASGGISSLEDIKNLKKLEPLGLEGVIIGRALYTGAFTLEEAIVVG